MNKLPMIKKSLAIVMTIMLALVIWPAMSGSAIAQETRSAPGEIVLSPPSSGQGLTDAAELETFLDALIESQLEEYHIAGAGVSVVKDGELFFAKGYGYANLENKTPIDPERTIFRIGSNGKTFTWTAVMQLVEQGKLDLDADVNTYLDFRIPDTFPQPITLKHLMTHMSGFEDVWSGSVVLDAGAMVPAGEWLRSHMAMRMRPPGEHTAYSNYNAMLAGYIVSRASGQPYDQYIQEHIFDPLGMAHSTVHEPIPPDLRPFASLGYMYVDGSLQLSPDYMAQPALLPSGAHQASVTDMARFMIAHLQNGRYSDENIPEVRILKEASAQQMHTVQLSPDPRFRGITYGFFDFTHSGQQTIGHRGYFTPMNSLLLLLPDQNLGVFVVYNSDGGAYLADPHSIFQKAFYEHYFPSPAVEPLQPPAGFEKRADRFVGSYRRTSFPSSSFMKVGAIFGMMTEQISNPGDGTLLGTVEGTEMRFVEVDPLYFRQVDGDYAIIFRQDDRGRITGMVIDPVNYTAYEKLDWYERSGFNTALLMICVLVFVTILPAAGIRFLWNRLSKSNQKLNSRGARAATWIITGISLLNLLIVAIVWWGANGGIQSDLLEPPLMIKIALGLGIVSAVLSAGALVYTVLAWKDRYWGTLSRSYYTLATFAAVAFVWFLNQWNLLGWLF